jgi:hypothetical protein
VRSQALDLGEALPFTAAPPPGGWRLPVFLQEFAMGTASDMDRCARFINEFGEDAIKGRPPCPKCIKRKEDK